MKLFTGITTLVVGLIISAVAGYFSIVGLAALFAAAGISVIIMGTSLEVGKLVAATWLKSYWGDRSIAFLHKAYLLLSVLVLMVITSIGIYGFLAAGHLEQSAPAAGLKIESQQYETRLAQRTDENKRLEGRLTQIDQNISAFLTTGAATKGLRASGTLKAERDQIAAKIDANNTEINSLNEKLAPIKSKSGMVEAKLGAVKYFAVLVGYGDDPEAAVRLLIMIMMVAFDPLAVVLVLSGMITLKQWETERKIVPTPVAVAPVVPVAVPVTTAEIAAAVDVGVSATVETQPPTITLEGSDIPVVITSEASGEQIIDTPEVETPVDTRTQREKMIDLLEQYPDIITDLVETARELENAPTSTTATTGATID